MPGITLVTLKMETSPRVTLPNSEIIFQRRYPAIQFIS